MNTCPVRRLPLLPALLVAVLLGAFAGAPPAAAAGPDPAAQLVKLEKKLTKRKIKQAKWEDKLALTVGLMNTAAAELLAAQAMPESTPQEVKAKQKAIKKWTKKLAKATAKMGKWIVKLADLQQDIDDIVEQILALDPDHPAGSGDFPPDPDPGPGPGPGPDPSPTTYDPPWGSAVPIRELELPYDAALSATANGARLKAAVNALLPGDRLWVDGGVWSVDSQFTLTSQGTAEAPVQVVAQVGQTPIVTRPDANKNVMNIGTSTPGSARYLVLRGLRITGGSAGIRIYGAQHLWIDQCEIHDTGDGGITANSVDTHHLYITRNHIHHTHGYGEGMYLGANNGASVMSQSVIALNHVHDTGGSQGDGIEVKQGSWGNWIAENTIRSTHYPCLLVYGTGGQPVNLIERNVLIGSDDSVLQVQGEAVVRNNVIIDGATGFQSSDHQGSTRDLTFVHNTIVNSGKAAQMSSWNNRPGMTFANNVVYSQFDRSIDFSGGSNGVAMGGNVVVGPTVNVPAFAYTIGNGLSDFADADWDGSPADVSPDPAGPIVGAGDPAFAVEQDLDGDALTGSLEAGAVDLP